MKYRMPLLSLILLIAVPGLCAAEERKAVFDLRSGDPERIQQRLIDDIKYMKAHYAERGIDFKAVVVISGRAYKYFIDDVANSPFSEDAELARSRPTLSRELQALNDDYDVRFEMCEVGMKERNIRKETLYSYVNADKLQAVYLVDWQSEGYAYVPVN